MLSNIRVIITSALIVGSATVISVFFSKFGSDIATLWLANAILVFLLLRSRDEDVHYWFLGGIIGILLSNLFYVENSIHNSIVYTIGNSIDSFLSYFFIKNYINNNFDDEFDVPKILGVFILSSSISGLFVSGFLDISSRTNFDIFVHWVLTKISGMTLLMPSLLLVSRKNFLTCRQWLSIFLLSLIIVLVNNYALQHSNTPLLIMVTVLIVTIIYSSPFPASILPLILVFSMFLMYKLYPTTSLDQVIFLLQDTEYEKYLPTLIISLLSFVMIMQKNIIYHRYEFLKDIADRDWLTGLYNRRYFEEESEKSLQNIRRVDDKKHVIIMMDLDRFKIINDSLGHSTGDIILKEIAMLILNQVRSTDVVARLGGDEFGIIVRESTMHDAVDIAKKIISKINEYRFKHKNQSYSIGVSIGLANMTCDIATAKEVLDRADIACYESKKRGRGIYTVYKETDSFLKERRTEIDIVNAIKNSLEQDLFKLYVHRIMAISPDREDYYEILLRMPCVRGDLISASEFLPVAERYNLIIDIDKWVFSHLAKHYNKIVLPKYRYSINVSGISLSNEEFVNYFYELMFLPEVDMSRVQIEITESTLITNVQLVQQFIATVRASGGRIILDDFGVGYSSFHYVKDFDVHTIKIDGSFIKNLNDETNYMIVENMVNLSKKLDIRTVAEFVDTEEKYEQVKSIGFDYAQGFWKYQPIPIDDLVLELKKEKEDAVW